MGAPATSAASPTAHGSTLYSGGDSGRTHEDEKVFIAWIALNAAILVLCRLAGRLIFGAPTWLDKLPWLRDAMVWLVLWPIDLVDTISGRAVPRLEGIWTVLLGWNAAFAVGWSLFRLIRHRQKLAGRTDAKHG